MDAFDKDCPRCHGDGLPCNTSSPAIQTSSNNTTSPPNDVALAVLILYGSLGVGLLNALLFKLPQAASKLPQIPVASLFIIEICVLALIGLFYYKISQGCNWARITLLIFCVLGALSSIPHLSQIFSHGVFSGLLGIGQTIAQIIALVLLFQEESSSWFCK
jgi:hypothetical protein